MSMIWVSEVDEEDNIRMGYHLGFRWKDSVVVQTACGKELDQYHENRWVDADDIVAPHPPKMVLCPECAALTVAEVDELYGKWMRDEL